MHDQILKPLSLRPQMRLAFVLVGEAEGPCFGDDNVHPQGEDCGMGKATAGHRRVHRPVLSGGEGLEDSTFIGGGR